MAADYPMTVMPIVCSEEGTLCFYLNDRLVIGNRAKTELKNFHRRTIIMSNNLHRVHDRPIPIVLGNFWATFGVWSNFLRF